MSDEPTKTDETQKVEEQPAKTATTGKNAGVAASSKQTYFFPEEEFSCEATSLEEATKLYEEHQKGVRK